MTASMHESHDTRTRFRLRPVPDAGVTDLEMVRLIRTASVQERRRAARSRDLTALLHKRPDLAGVHAPADLTVAAVRWSV
jgi:hypothetical protein